MLETSGANKSGRYVEVKARNFINKWAFENYGENVMLTHDYFFFMYKLQILTFQHCVPSIPSQNLDSVPATPVPKDTSSQHPGKQPVSNVPRIILIVKTRTAVFY